MKERKLYRRGEGFPMHAIDVHPSDLKYLTKSETEVEGTTVEEFLQNVITDIENALDPNPQIIIPEFWINMYHTEEAADNQHYTKYVDGAFYTANREEPHDRDIFNRFIATHGRKKVKSFGYFTESSAGKLKVVIYI